MSCALGLQDRIAELAHPGERGAAACDQLGVERRRRARRCLASRGSRPVDARRSGSGCRACAPDPGAIAGRRRRDSATPRCSRRPPPRHGRADRGDGGRTVLRLDDDLAALAAAQPEQRRGSEGAGQPRGERRRGVVGGPGPVGGARDADQRRERRIAQRIRRRSSSSPGSRGVVPRGEHDRGRLGASVWTITRPSVPPRPARPASCATSAKVRSSARKSGKRRVVSASTTTPSSTSGKSWPFATSCVPSRIAAVGAPGTRPGHCRVAGSRASRRRTSPAGELLGERSVPVPWRAIETEPQSGQRRGIALAVAAVMAGERALRAVQDERHVAVRALPRAPAASAGQKVGPAAPVEQDDRLSARRERLDACAGAARRAAPSRSTISTGGSARRRRARASAMRGSARTDSARGVALPDQQAPSARARRSATRRAS